MSSQCFHSCNLSNAAFGAGRLIVFGWNGQSGRRRGGLADGGREIGSRRMSMNETPISHLKTPEKQPGNHQNATKMLPRNYQMLPNSGAVWRLAGWGWGHNSRGWHSNPMRNRAVCTRKIREKLPKPDRISNLPPAGALLVARTNQVRWASRAQRTNGIRIQAGRCCPLMRSSNAQRWKCDVRAGSRALARICPGANVAILSK